jgi:hypothetical protein
MKMMRARTASTAHDRLHHLTAEARRHRIASTIRIGYYHEKTCGAISPAAMPPIMPPADIHM